MSEQEKKMCVKERERERERERAILGKRVIIDR